MFSRFKARRNYWRDSRGGVAVSFAAASVAIFVAAGCAIDYAHEQLVQTDLQSALDASLISAVSATRNKSQQIDLAARFFKVNAAKYADVTPTFSHEKSLLVGALRHTMQTALLGVVGISELPVVAQAKVTAGVSYLPLCIAAMHPSRKHTLEMKGSVKIVAPDCTFYGNSNHYNDVVDPHTPQNFMTGKHIAAIGGGHHYLENVTPPVEFGAELIPDPLADKEQPTHGACTKMNHVVSSGTVSLPPGHYCGGLKITGGAIVTLVPESNYTISGGPFEITNGTLNGSNSVIFLADSRTTVQWTNAQVTLKPATKGDYKGMSVFGARVATSNTITDSKIDVEGVFYMPQGDFVWQNKGDFTPTAKWSSFIADGFSWIGSGTLRFNFDLTNSKSEFPDGLVAYPMPGDVRIVK